MYFRDGGVSLVLEFICRFCSLLKASRQVQQDYGNLTQTVGGSIAIKKHAKIGKWLMDQANLGKTEQVDYTIVIYHTSAKPAATGSLDR